MRRLYLKTWKVYFFQVDVTFGPESQVAKDCPGFYTAIVDCVIPAQNMREAKVILREVLDGDGFSLRAIIESGNMLDLSWEDEVFEEEYYYYAWKAYRDGIPSYGTFYAYQPDDEAKPSKYSVRHP